MKADTSDYFSRPSDGLSWVERGLIFRSPPEGIDESRTPRGLAGRGRSDAGVAVRNVDTGRRPLFCPLGCRAIVGVSAPLPSSSGERACSSTARWGSASTREPPPPRLRARAGEGGNVRRPIRSSHGGRPPPPRTHDVHPERWHPRTEQMGPPPPSSINFSFQPPTALHFIESPGREISRR